MVIRIFFILVLLTLLSEGVVRFFVTSPSNQVFDAELGWVYIPKTKVMNGREGFAENIINNIGFNDDDVGGGLKNNILFLGDSFTEALHVEKKYNFTALIENEQYNSINAGRSALNPVHYLTILSRVEKIAKINKIILVMSTGDLADMVNAPADVSYAANGDIINIKLKSSRNDNIKSIIEPIVHNSALATHIMRRMKPFVEDVAAVFKEKPKTTNPEIIMAATDQKVKLLSYILSRLNKNNNVSIVYIPSMVFNGKGVLPLTKGVLEEWRIIIRVSDKYSIPYVNAAKFIEEDYYSRGVLPFGFDNSIIGEGHLNRYGHMSVARAIQSVLLNKKITRK